MSEFTDNQFLERLGLIKEIAARQKRVAKIKEKRKAITRHLKRNPVQREFAQVPKNETNINNWTDASKYANEYYGETMRETTRFDNDWD